MSTTPPTPSKVLSVFLGVLGAFATFAVLTVLLQWGFTKTDDSEHQARQQKLHEVKAEQHALLEKAGLAGDATPVFEKVVAELKSRKVTPTQMLDPKSPTAKKAAAASEAAEAEAAKTEEAAPTPAAES